MVLPQISEKERHVSYLKLGASFCFDALRVDDIATEMVFLHVILYKTCRNAGIRMKSRTRSTFRNLLL
jgi:hypothetical protein